VAFQLQEGFSAVKTRQFVDTVAVHARAGKGGNGVCSFRREKFVPRGGPDGGDGGHGGDVVFCGDEDVDSLVALFFESRLFAENGQPGGGRRMKGRNGQHLVIPVPLGTMVVDEETGEELGDVVAHDQLLVVARGGRGGLGNVHWKRADHQAPREFTPGTEGEERRLRLDLRMMADAGLVGFPSAGKSSLLRCISRARPKVAAYPFTTLKPIIGTVVDQEKFTSFRVADIPGLIEDAHLGSGLGFDFLRHIERSRILVFVLDMAGVDGRQPWDDYRALLHELKMRDPALLERERLVLANKMDLPEAAGKLAQFERETGEVPLPISTVSREGVPELVQLLFDMIQPQPRLPGQARRTTRSLRSAQTARSIRTLREGRKSGGRAPRKTQGAASTDQPRKGYTPPRPLEGRGEHPGAEDVVSDTNLEGATFLEL